MAIEVRQFPQRDSGTGFAKQIEGPVTYESPVDQNSTGFATQQDDEVTYQDLDYRGKPTGAAKQQPEEVTTVDAATAVLRKQRTSAVSDAKPAKNKARSAETRSADA